MMPIFAQPCRFCLHTEKLTVAGGYKECGKSFTGADSLKTHQHIHSVEGQYICSDCGKSFSQAWLLKCHQRLHLGEDGDGSFNSSRNLETMRQMLTGKNLL